jgi:hypothetical protein
LVWSVRVVEAAAVVEGLAPEETGACLKLSFSV